MDESIFDILKARISYGKLGNAQIPSLNIVRYNQGFSYPFGTNQDVQQEVARLPLQYKRICHGNQHTNLILELNSHFLDYKLNGEIDIYERIPIVMLFYPYNFLTHLDLTHFYLT